MHYCIFVNEQYAPKTFICSFFRFKLSENPIGELAWRIIGFWVKKAETCYFAKASPGLACFSVLVDPASANPVEGSKSEKEKILFYPLQYCCL